MQETLGSIPGLGRSPGEGKGYSLQYSGLENFPVPCVWAVIHFSQENEALKVKSHLVNYISLPQGAMWFSGYAIYPETFSQDAIYPSLWQKLLPQSPSKMKMKRLVT